MANDKSKVINRKRQPSRSQAQRRLLASEKLARRIGLWHKRLAPKYPDIDPHDLHLIIAELLKTRKERMELMFLKRREDGSYVF